MIGRQFQLQGSQRARRHLQPEAQPSRTLLSPRAPVQTEDMFARLFHQQSKILAIQVAKDRVLAVEPGAAESQRERLQTQYPSQRRWIHDHPLAASRKRVAVKYGAVARLQKLRRL